MATKNLARTIIEGGRARSNQWERNYSHRRERASMREFLRKACETDEGFDRLSAPQRNRVYKGFADKLGAPRRWLASQVGRPWDKVHAEIFARFDPRTLAGRHIIFDHLLQEVSVHQVTAYWSWLYVDRHGILRERAPRRTRYRWESRSTELPESLGAWAAGRRVADAGAACFWLEEARTCETCHAGRRTPCCCPVIEGASAHGPHVHYRQGEPLSADDVARWRSLDASWQELLRGPRRPNPS